MSIDKYKKVCYNTYRSLKNIKYIKKGQTNMIINIILSLIYMTFPVILLSIILNKAHNIKPKHKCTINSMYKETKQVIYI